MKKIVITESQYSRVFLLEQYTTKDGKFYGANDVDRYKKEVLNQQNTILLNKFEQAQQQWKKNKAPDPKTGHKLLPQELLDYLKSEADKESSVYKSQIEKEKEANDSENYQKRLIDIQKNIGLDTNHPSKVTPDLYNKAINKTNDAIVNLSKKSSDAYKDYNAAKDWNDLINNQKTLIPQWCTKQTNYKWFVTPLKDIDRDNPSIVQQCKNAFSTHWRYPGQYYTHPNTKKKFKYTGEKQVFCKYRLDIGENPMNRCNNPTDKGPFVYKNDKVSGGHICMCINLDDREEDQIYQAGQGYKYFSKEEQFNLINRHKEWLEGNKPGFWESVLNTPNIIMDCATDYHCWLDIASIAALAIPGWGLVVSAGIDLANSGAYFIEAMNADDPAEANLLYGAATITALSAIPGVGKAARIAKGGNKVTQNVIKELTSDYAKLIKNTSGKPSAKQIDNILAKSIANKSLKDSDKLVIKNFYKALEFGSAETKRFLMGFDKFKKLHKVEFEKFLKNPPKEFTDILKLSKGNVVEALWKFRKQLSKSDALLQAKWFTALYAILPPSVQVYSDKKDFYKRSGVYGPKDMVNTEYPGAWNLIKQIFMSDGSKTDNLLFTKAWNAGWRPNIKIVNKQWVADDNQPIIPKIYQTKSMKKVLADYLKLTQNKVISGGGDYNEVLDMEGGEFSLEDLDIDIDMD